MSKFKIEFLNSAWKELDDISNYYFQVTSSTTAKKVTDKILKSIKRLEDMPFSCPFIRDDFLKSEGYRMLVCGDYLCFYRVIQNTVFIYHIANGKRNYKKLFD